MTSDSACWGNDSCPSISAIGEALVALEREIAALEQEGGRLMARRNLIQQKLVICHKSIRQLLVNAGHTYKPKQWPHYPELNRLDEEV